jgi:hypothetical protein
MSRASKLQPIAAPGDNSTTRPMKRKDEADDILEAFAGNVPREDLSPEELDAVYSKALSEGLLTEGELRGAFARFLDRKVVRSPETGEATLSPRSSSNVGECVVAHREHRKLSREELARQSNMTVEQISAIEGSVEPYLGDRLMDVSKVVALAIGAPTARVHTLLQSIKATQELKSATGPSLMAARKAPPK